MNNNLQITSDSEKLLGYHWLAQFFECKSKTKSGKLIIDDANELKKAFVETADIAKTKEIGSLSHQFSPQGATAVVQLSESHEAGHSWPEKSGTLVYDLFSCNLQTPGLKALKSLGKKLGASSFIFTQLARYQDKTKVLIENQKVDLAC